MQPALPILQFPIRVRKAFTVLFPVEYSFRHGVNQIFNKILSSSRSKYYIIVLKEEDLQALVCVGNMMQDVVLDGNPLNGDEDMRLLTCVVLDGNPPDEAILDLMDLVI